MHYHMGCLICTAAYPSIYGDASLTTTFSYPSSGDGPPFYSYDSSSYISSIFCGRDCCCYCQKIVSVIACVFCVLRDYLDNGGCCYCQKILNAIWIFCVLCDLHLQYDGLDYDGERRQMTKNALFYVSLPSHLNLTPLQQQSLLSPSSCPTVENTKTSLFS